MVDALRATSGMAIWTKEAVHDRCRVWFRHLRAATTRHPVGYSELGDQTESARSPKKPSRSLF